MDVKIDENKGYYSKHFKRNFFVVLLILIPFFYVVDVPVPKRRRHEKNKRNKGTKQKAHGIHTVQQLLSVMIIYLCRN